MKKRLFSMLLVVCMVFTMFPTAAFATEGNVPVGTSNTGDNVTIDSGTPTVCPHEHDNTCGFIEAVEGSPCTHECELCKPAKEDSITPPAEDCDCTVKCIAADEANEIEAAIKADCPVCGIANADLASVCKGEASALLKAPRVGETSWDIGVLTATDIKATLSADGTTLAITGSGAMKDWSQRSDVPWKADRATIETITITVGITNIGKYAFSDCTALTSITIPASVTSIGERAFSDCELLERITIPAGVTVIGERAFSDCELLERITIPAGVTSIGYAAFYNCSALESITFAVGSQLETIGDYAFEGCKLLESITIPAGVTSIGAYTFNRCYALESVTFAEGSQLKTIDRYAFPACTALTSITIPAGVTSIGAYAFFSGKALKSVTFAEGSQLETIDEYAFYNCTALTSVTFTADNQLTIGNFIFYKCTELTSVTFKGTTAPTLGAGVFYDHRADLKIYIPFGSTGYTGETASNEWKALVDTIVETQSWDIGKGNETDVKATLSGTTLAITGSGAMMNWAKESDVPWNADRDTITIVTIAKDITNIGDSAFSRCTMLTTVTFAEGSQLTSIGNNAFPGCNSLEIITIPKDVTAIGNDAFQRCTALKSITIPEGVTTIGSSAFSDCAELESVIFTEGSQLTTIGSNAFDGCATLKNITIPEGVTTIGNRAFNNCESLESITFKSKTAPTLGTDVFANTHTDLKITIPNGSTGYTGETASNEWKALNDKIVKETPTISDLTYNLTAVDYNRTAQPVSVTKKTAGIGTITVKYGTSTTAPTNAGVYAITVDIAGSAEYNAATDLSLDNYTIKKVAATPAMTTVAASVSMDGKAGATVTLPTKPDGAVYGTPAASGAIAMTAMSINGNTLTYTAPASAAGQTGVITIPVTTATNYNDYSITVTITSTAKTPQSISFANAAVSKTYGDANFTATATRNSGDGAITYKSGTSTVATVNTTTGEVTIVGQGSATITATAAETDTFAEATATYTLTIAKAPLTITADNKSMTVGGTKPTYTATPTGLVKGETISGVTFTDGSPDTTIKGTATITPVGGTITGGGSGNYTITYANGALTINIDVSSIDTALAAANTAKSGVTINEGVASDVASGTKFVNAAEMTALTDAIQTATDAKLLVTTIAEAQAAAAALDGVVTTFKAAIKTGTKSTGGGGGGSTGGGGGSTGGGSSSGGSNVIVTPPAPDQPNDPTQAEIKIDTKVDDKGSATVNITDKNITDAIVKGAQKQRKTAMRLTALSSCFVPTQETKR